jgi:octaprenyl-diphosphate synthase
MAFQIKDDLFDFLGSESQTGKDAGGDVKKNMITLPLIFSLENSTKTQSKKLKSLVRSKKKTKTNLKDINEMISESGGFRYAKDKLNEFSEKAIDAIQGYEDSEIKKSLTQLVSFNIKRKM